ncbi:MAG TPA: hypothetical protein VEM60_04450 [Candidatus Dormibacteraeota bacterium]|nr:hypothetical protein [Candidatus Dormibacteraeota bacterium]
MVRRFLNKPMQLNPQSKNGLELPAWLKNKKYQNGVGGKRARPRISREI